MVSFRSFMASAVLLCAQTVWAEPQYDRLEVTDGVFMKPALAVDVEFDDNIFRLNRNAQSSLVTRVAPAVELETAGDGTRLVLGYGGNYGFVASSSDDNYDHHTVRLDGHLERPRSEVDVTAAFTAASDPRGTGPSDALGLADRVAFTAPAKFEDWRLGVDARFGTRGTRAGASLGYEVLDRKYQNLRDFTRPRDRRRHDFRAGSHYMLTGRTRAVVNVSRTHLDYGFQPEGDATLDSVEHRATAGIRWEGIGGSTGTVQVGWHEKDFDAETRSDQSGLTWEAGVTWTPGLRATLGAFTRSGFEETHNVGSARKVARAGVLWGHTWRDGLRSRVEVEYVEETFRDLDRKDEFHQVAVGLDYDVTPWLTVGAGARYSNRDSNVRAADYDRSVGFVQVKMSL